MIQVSTMVRWAGRMENQDIFGGGRGLKPDVVQRFVAYCSEEGD